MSGCPEQALWQEVLLRQIEDALHGPPGIAGIEHRIQIIETARRFLTKHSNQLEDMCTLADVETDAVVSRMRTLIAKAPSPEEIAHQHKAQRSSLLKRTRPQRVQRTKVAERPLTLHGQTRTIAEWAAVSGISIRTILSRLYQDWSVERVLTQPVGKRVRVWGAKGGVGDDFAASMGTGGGRSAQESRNIDFSDGKVT